MTHDRDPDATLGKVMAEGGETGRPMIGRAGLTTASANVLTLSNEECWALLRSHNLGRLAIVVEGRPRIFPLNYAAAEDTVVFRTEPGAKLQHGPGFAACFEIDDYDPGTVMAWSVMVVGVLEDITDATDERSRRLRSLPVEPAAPGSKLHWLALNVDEMSGRSFRGGWIVPGHYLG
ncbi:MAG: pyridoxamine 5'-phosphate oxidase family protein [Candidatus Dormibacteraeota bacterium]|nr:pyridoxamine 5'-phosphate oxidase family protein [Candidatus Dormibacteraeota bacterium]